MGLPITCADIINLPMDEFNDLLSKHELTEEQLTLCRDIRRRGKNKVAAQNCRKRKIDQVSCDWWSGTRCSLLIGQGGVCQRVSGGQQSHADADTSDWVGIYHLHG